MMVVFPGGRGGRETELLVRSPGAAAFSGVAGLSGSAAGCEVTSCCDRALATGKTNAAAQSMITAQVLFISAHRSISHTVPYRTAQGAVLDTLLLNLDDSL